MPFARAVRTGEQLLIQFDGSTRAAGTEYACGGAGVVAWLITPDSVKLLDWALFPGRSLVNAELAEAKGAQEAVTMAKKHVRATTTSVTIQGDNAAVISFFQGTAKTNQVHMAELFYETDRNAHSLALNVNWEYIPREANPWADHLAGLASATLFQQMAEGSAKTS